MPEGCRSLTMEGRKTFGDVISGIFKFLDELTSQLKARGNGTYTEADWFSMTSTASGFDLADTALTVASKCIPWDRPSLMTQTK